MIGSAKQVAWAEKIRAPLLAQWGAALAAVEASGRPNAEAITLLRGIFDYAATIEHAAFWIDSRGGRMRLDAEQQKTLCDKFGAERRDVLRAVDHLLWHVNRLADQAEGK